ncbi:hypothetical protein MTP03_24700 [Tsukamurella sp. PLM1]|nr:hypothetical protein MTP03_24700 [Tsukamurella sp. PLM1]
MSADRIPDGAVLLLGGRSEVGMEVARRLAPGRDVVLAARRSTDLAAQTAVLRDAGATGVFPVEFDADVTAEHGRFLAEVADRFGRVGVAIVAFGILGDQARAEADPAHAVQIAQTDYVAQVSILLGLAKLLRAQDAGPAGVPDGARSSPSPRWPGCGSARRTSSTAVPRPASTGSYRGSPIRCTAPGSRCCWRDRGSS